MQKQTNHEGRITEMEHMAAAQEQLEQDRIDKLAMHWTKVDIENQNLARARQEAAVLLKTVVQTHDAMNRIMRALPVSVLQPLTQLFAVIAEKPHLVSMLVQFVGSLESEE